MTIIINSWKLEPSLNALVHEESGEIQRLGEFHYILLETLVQHAGEVLSRNFLITEVWKNRVVGNNSLPTAIYALRTALGDDGKQQEIIKTIPKKGYIFSKEAIVQTSDENSPTFSIPAIQAQPDIGEENNSADEFLARPDPLTQPLAHHADAPRKETSTSGNKNKRRLRVILTSGIILLFAGVVAGYQLWPSTNIAKPSQINPAPQNALTLSAVNRQADDKLKIFRLHYRGTERANPSPMEHAPEILTPLNQMLTTKHASATLYYYHSIDKLSVDIIVSNQCQKEYQLVMNIRNWASDTAKLGQLISHEVERTLNEMPACK